jgi:tRNA A-37 threonylcarbamoyl transferase component Bud32|tara:strand:+ start:27322 stop:28017 length:696 start_codon:yes stop_codon:yes gene_type:complete
MKISAFQIMDEESQSFLTTRYSELVQQFSLNTILINHKPSLVGVLHDSDLVIKFIKARSWHEYLKLIWNHSRVTKEVKGTEILEDLGLNVPVIHQVGYGVIPSSRYDYLGYYIMENLTLSGYQELSKLIKDGGIDLIMRKKVMKAVYEGLKLMRDNHIVFSDFHLDNVFANNQGKITWIDAGVTTYHKLNKVKFKKKYDHSITRFIAYSNDRGNTLFDEETAMFNSLLLQS